MRISARNQLKSGITKVVHAWVSADVSRDLAPGMEFVSVITDNSARAVAMGERMEAHAVIRASNVMIETD